MVKKDKKYTPFEFIKAYFWSYRKVYPLTFNELWENDKKIGIWYDDNLSFRSGYTFLHKHRYIKITSEGKTFKVTEDNFDEYKERIYIKKSFTLDEMNAMYKEYLKTGEAIPRRQQNINV